MIIAHLPAGYMVSRQLHPYLANTTISNRMFLLTGLAGSIAPDIDLLYFFLIDQCRHHHHTYWTHFPSVWGLLLLGAIFLYTQNRQNSFTTALLIFSLNGFIHLLLDSVVGDIWWLAPFVDRPFALFSVAALFKSWWLNFLIHWSFALEILIIIVAASKHVFSCTLRNGLNKQ